MPLTATAGTASAEPYGYAIAPARDRNFQTNTALVTGNGVNGTNNNTFLDSSTANSGSGWPLTVGGNPTQGSYSPFSVPDGYWSYFFTSNIISPPAGITTAMGTTGLAGKRFTMETFIFPQYFTTAKSGLAPIFGVYEAVAANGRWFWGYSATSATTAKLSFTYTTGTASEVTALASTATIPVNQWSHVAVTIDATTAASTTISFFVNGALVSTSTGNNLSTQTTYYATPNIGFINDSGSYNRFGGYLSNLRITYNAILYTGSYTVPRGPLTASASTALLTCQGSTLRDISPNNFIMVNGSAFSSPISPFLYPFPYSPAITSGAIYFDGAGDYVSVPDSAGLELGANDFCFECLFFSGNTSGTRTLIQKRNGTGVAPIIVWTSASAVQVYLGSVTQGDIVNGVSLGNTQTSRWYHVAVYRIGTSVYGSLNGNITTLKTGTSLSVLNNAEPYTIGMNGNGTSDPFFGFITNARLVIGSSVYTATSAPVPTTPLANITNTKFLLLGSNAAIVDSTSNNAISTNNASISTAQSKYGSGSMSFNGTNSYVRFFSGYANFGSLVPLINDFTVELFVNPTDFAATRTILTLSANGGAYAAVRIDIATTGRVTLYSSTDGSTWAINTSPATALVAGSWTHLAVVRNAGSITLYINGVVGATSTAIAQGTYLLASINAYLGTNINASFFFLGYMSGFRISNIARYTGAFTPPTGLFPVQS